MREVPKGFVTSGSVKIPGCCSVCDEPIFEIKRRIPRDHPLAGLPVELGGPLRGAKRHWLMMADGTFTNFSTCADCEITSHNICEVWAKARELMAREGSNAYREVFSRNSSWGFMSPHTPKQEMKMGHQQLAYGRNIIFGVLTTQDWSEVQ